MNLVRHPLVYGVDVILLYFHELIYDKKDVVTQETLMEIFKVSFFV